MFSPLGVEMKLLNFCIHRKEQFDIAPGGIKNPLVVVGYETPGRYTRLLCVWSGGFSMKFIHNTHISYSKQRTPSVWEWRAECPCGYRSAWSKDWKAAIRLRAHSLFHRHNAGDMRLTCAKINDASRLSRK